MKKIILLTLFVFGIACGMVLSKSITVNKTVSGIRVVIDPDGTAFADYTVDYGEVQKTNRISFKSANIESLIKDAQTAVNELEGLP